MLPHTCNANPNLSCMGCLSDMATRMREEPRDLLAEAFQIAEGDEDLAFSNEHLIALANHIRELDDKVQTQANEILYLKAVYRSSQDWPGRPKGVAR